jgi:hypothetical protein
MRAATVHVVLSVLLVMATGCRSNEPLKVSAVQVGRALNSDNSVATITNRFKPDDTMYASVITDGAGSSTMVARWTGLGRMINESKKEVSYTDRAATEFHIELAGGFPPGDYKVEIIVDGNTVATRDLRVER